MNSKYKLFKNREKEQLLKEIDSTVVALESVYSKFENVTEIEFNNEMKNNIKAAYESGVTGIFCFSDYVAKECVDALTELKLSVPDDVSLISVDDTLISKVYKLTSITHAKEKIGEIAAKSIIERNLPVMKIFSPDISERDSVKRIKWKHSILD